MDSKFRLPTEVIYWYGWRDTRLYCNMPAGESGEESPSDAPVRKKRGSSGLPHGVIQVKRRFQARAPFKADGATNTL